MCIAAIYPGLVEYAQRRGSAAKTPHGAVRALRADGRSVDWRAMRGLSSSPTVGGRTYCDRGAGRYGYSESVGRRQAWLEWHRRARLAVRAAAACAALGYWPRDAAEAEAGSCDRDVRGIIGAWVREQVDLRELVASSRGSLVYGAGGQDDSEEVYSRGYTRRYGPARWKNAGWTMERQPDDSIQIRIENFRGTLKQTFTLPLKSFRALLAIARRPASEWRAAWYPLVARNQERARRLIAARGIEAVARALAAETLRTEGDLALLRVPAARCGDREDMVLLRVTCPSTQAYYLLRVPPEYAGRPCEDARRWTLRIPADARILREA
jgi:hypothetical protein